MGSSQGGAVSALISAKRDDIKGTVLLYPALGIPSSVSKWYSSKDKVPEEVKMTQKITVGKKYFLDVWDYDVYSEIVKDKKDILIIQGTSDLLVLPSQTKKVHKIYENSELYFIEGAGHGFDGDDFDEAMGYITNYLKKMKVIK
jgi:dienelactone hydrolase